MTVSFSLINIFYFIFISIVTLYSLVIVTRVAVDAGESLIFNFKRRMSLRRSSTLLAGDVRTVYSTMYYYTI